VEKPDLSGLILEDMDGFVVSREETEGMERVYKKFITDCLSTGGNAIASNRPSMRPFVFIVTFEPSDL